MVDIVEVADDGIEVRTDQHKLLAGDKLAGKSLKELPLRRLSVLDLREDLLSDVEVGVHVLDVVVVFEGLGHGE